MPTCEECGKEVMLPYNCGYCGGSFCSKHRLPENHECSGLDEVQKESQEEGKIYRGVSDELKREPTRKEESKDLGGEILRPGPEIESGEEESRGGGLLGGGGPLNMLKGFFFQRMTTVLLLIMILMGIVQIIGWLAFSGNYYQPETSAHPADFDTFLYFLAPSRDTVITRPWTLVTSLFAHGGFFHLMINGIVFFFIGSALERRIGRKKFVYLFLVSGIVAGMAQLYLPEALRYLFLNIESLSGYASNFATNPTIVVLGASGAILGILGALTALSPRMPVLLFFIIPMPLWILTLGYGIISAFMAFTGVGGSIGHMAHFAGLIVGLIYGYKLKKDMKKRRHPLQELLDRYSW